MGSVVAGRIQEARVGEAFAMTKSRPATAVAPDRRRIIERAAVQADPGRTSRVPHVDHPPQPATQPGQHPEHVVGDRLEEPQGDDRDTRADERHDQGEAEVDVAEIGADILSHPYTMTRIVTFRQWSRRRSAPAPGGRLLARAPRDRNRSAPRRTVRRPGPTGSG